VTYSYNPSGTWTATHQMTLNGKRDAFVMADVVAAAKVAGLKRGRAKAILDEVRDAVKQWPRFGARAKLTDDVTEKIRRVHQLDLAK
jgi:serine/threonine-protein kinase HipA